MLTSELLFEKIKNYLQEKIFSLSRKGGGKFSPSQTFWHTPCFYARTRVRFKNKEKNKNILSIIFS